MARRILVADIGGTNARFAFANVGGEIAVEPARILRAADFATIGDAVAAFLGDRPEKPEAACFAVAAPVTGETVAFTNSHWSFEIPALKKRLGVSNFRVVNDFAALAASVRQLRPSDLFRVKDGEGDARAPILVLGPGSGLGQALIVPLKKGDYILATQGGHVGFAPSNEAEIAVLRHLMRDHGRVSIERLLSGQGIENIHRALGGGDALRADEITGAPDDPLAEKAVAMFCAILGAAAGDAALAAGAWGGVCLGGGILPRIRETLKKSEFTQRFCAKGRMRALLEPVPVDLIVRENAALLGAAAMMKEDGAQGRN